MKGLESIGMLIALMMMLILLVVFLMLLAVPLSLANDHQAPNLCRQSGGQTICDAPIC